MRTPRAISKLSGPRGPLIVLLVLGIAASSAAAPATKDEVALVEKFLKLPTSELQPAAIDKFVTIDPETLPKKLRKPYQAKRVELYTLKQLGEGKKKGLIRTVPDDCAEPTDAGSKDGSVLLMAGYEEVQGDDVNCVMERTKCTEREMMCDFTLRIVVERKPKGKKYRFFFHPNDPLMAIVAACRKSTGGQNNFFSSVTATCLH